MPDGLDVEVVTDEAIEAAVCRTDPLARRKKIRLADVRDETLIGLPVGAGVRHQFDFACAERASTADRVEASTPFALADLAARDPASRSCLHLYRDRRADLHGLTFVPELRGRLVLAWRSAGPISPAARVLIDRARRLLRVSARA